MRPLTVALLCAACCFGAAGTSYLLFEFLHEPANPAPTPTVHETSERGPVAEVDTAPVRDTRVDVLEAEIEMLREQLNELKDRQDERADAGGTVTAAGGEGGNASDVREELEALKAQIETAGAGAGAMREGALLDLESGNGRERREAAELLGLLAKGGDEAAKQALLDALKNEDPDVREDALEGIAKSGLPEFLPALEAAMNDENADVREEVAEALRDMPIEQAGPLLAKMLSDDDEDVLMEAVDALGDANYEGAREDIRPLTQHSNERIAVEAAIALRRTGDSTVAEGWVPTLGSRVNSQDRDERRHAVRQLRRMRLESARPYLEQALESDDGRVRRDARRGLEELDER